MTTNLFLIANCEPAVVLEFYCIISEHLGGVGVLNSAIFNSFHNRVEFGTILVGLRNFGGGGVNPQTPLGTPLLCTMLSCCQKIGGITIADTWTCHNEWGECMGPKCNISRFTSNEKQSSSWRFRVIQNRLTDPCNRISLWEFSSHLGSFLSLSNQMTQNRVHMSSSLVPTLS